jgi:hypothetical protein
LAEAALKLSKRTIGLIALLCFGALAVLAFGFDLLDGEADLRRRHLSASGAPVRFWVAGSLLFLFAVPTLILGWFVVRSEARQDAFLARRRPPPFDDPSRRTRL